MSSLSGCYLPHRMSHHRPARVLPVRRQVLLQRAQGRQRQVRSRSHLPQRSQPAKGKSGTKALYLGLHL